MISQDNPFATPSELPYALPPFDRIADEHYRPAFEAGLAEQVAEVEAIAGNPETPTFDNTVVALERSGRLLSRVAGVFFNLAGSDSNDTIHELQAAFAPKLASHHDAIYLNEHLFARVSDLFQQRESLNLDAESAWLLDAYHTDFQPAGAGLPAQDQQRLRVLNAELSTLSTQFSQNLLKDTNELALVVDDVAELAGLSADAV